MGALALANGHGTHGQAELQNVALAEGCVVVSSVLQADKFDAQVCVAGRLVDRENLRGKNVCCDECCESRDVAGTDHKVFEREVGVRETALMQLQHAEGHALKNLKMISV